MSLNHHCPDPGSTPATTSSDAMRPQAPACLVAPVSPALAPTLNPGTLRRMSSECALNTGSIDALLQEMEGGKPARATSPAHDRRATQPSSLMSTLFGADAPCVGMKPRPFSVVEDVNPRPGDPASSATTPVASVIATSDDAKVSTSSATMPDKMSAAPVVDKSLRGHGPLAPVSSLNAAEQLTSDKSPLSIQRELVATEFYRHLAGKNGGSALNLTVDAKEGAGRSALERTLDSATSGMEPDLVARRIRVVNTEGIVVGMPKGVADNREKILTWAADQVAAGNSLTVVTGSAARTSLLAADLAIARPKEGIGGNTSPTPSGIFNFGRDELVGAAGFQAERTFEKNAPLPPFQLAQQSEMLSSMASLGRDMERERLKPSSGFEGFIAAMAGNTPKTPPWQDIFAPGSPGRLEISPPKDEPQSSPVDYLMQITPISSKAPVIQVIAPTSYPVPVDAMLQDLAKENKKTEPIRKAPVPTTAIIKEGSAPLSAEANPWVRREAMLAKFEGDPRNHSETLPIIDTKGPTSQPLFLYGPPKARAKDPDKN